MSWTVRRLSPTRLAAILLVAFVALIVGWFGFGRPLLGLLGAAMILGATADSWLGTHFRLDETGASARTGPSVTAMGWGEVRRIVENGSEIRLSPLPEPSALDPFRGVGLVPLPENREAVRTFIEASMNTPFDTETL